jgi:hypothetical protein
MLLHLPRMAGHGDEQRVKNGPALAGHGAEAVRDAIVASITTLPEVEGGKYSIRISGRPGIDLVEASQHRPPDRGSFATRASRQRALETEACGVGRLLL